ncbi:hypothetical protein GCM10027612_15640 [Microbispora bryophytorum subsp. camponoti]
MREPAGSGRCEDRQHEHGRAAEQSAHDDPRRHPPADGPGRHDRVEGVQEPAEEGERDTSRVHTSRARTARSPPPVTSTAHPATAAAVASAQRPLGRSRPAIQDRRPVKTGPLPMATTVPIATPVLATAAK